MFQHRYEKIKQPLQFQKLKTQKVNEYGIRNFSVLFSPKVFLNSQNTYWLDIRVKKRFI